MQRVSRERESRILRTENFAKICFHRILQIEPQLLFLFSDLKRMFIGKKFSADEGAIAETEA